MATAIPRSEVVRNAEQLLAETRDLIDGACRTVLEGLPAEVRHIAGYHAGWWEADGRPSSRMGKAVRPAFALACARAVGGESADAVSAAVAVELTHDFSLLHDDVMDGDRVRRGRPAVWVVFGIARAILVGDALLTSAMDVLGAGDHVRVLAAACLELCQGQSADLTFESRDEVGLAECLLMAERKTGALLGAACELGALAAGAAPQTAGLYREFGRQLGVGFQLVDDLLGIWGDPSVTGKPAGNDLLARKRSLPVVAALNSGTEFGSRLSGMLRTEAAPDAETVARVTALIEAAGGRDWAQAEADNRLVAALKCLEQASPSSVGLEDLRLLANLMVRRDR